ncbi:ExeM/NucH family extracellular endonuclease [Nocardioides anomalus]|uniref:ExeM/NucH family extracellular endonuclease n=1 Tax=Nocardioides anomalus TaxID=2712223 RepID=A0A6G6WEF0_9ACTN|nr:ExeM/NucH family extracellular endonuclease [Nocardioides anomalus]QIG43589.1 ExeM/NucH family extracellular endonuclease [Nocardioides anomalus]
MPSSRPRRRARLSALVTGALALGGAPLLLAPGSAEAVSATVLINEVYVNGGSAGATYTNKYVELRNLTGEDIALSGMSIQYRAPGTTGASGIITQLTGSIPAHGYYVVVGGSNGANGAAVPTTTGASQSATGSFNPGGGGGTVALINGSTSVDLATLSNSVDKLGYGTSNAPEGGASGAGPTGNSVTMSIGRTSATDTDVNTDDFAAQTPTPNADNPTASATVALTNPGPQSGYVGYPIAPLQLVASGGDGTRSYTATGLPAGLSLDPATGVVTGTPTTAEAPTVTVGVTDTSGTDSEQFTWTISAAPASSAIATIQGTGSASAQVGQRVATQGVVTARYPTGGLNGFFVQTPGPDTANASDAIFVQGSGTYPDVGTSVDVVGTVSESFDLTRLTGAVWRAHTPSLGAVQYKTVIPGTDCPLPGDTCLSGATLDTAREVVEGEAFQPAASNPWTLTDVYDGRPYYGTGDEGGSSNFGELGVAAESDQALVAPTELFDAQTQAVQVTNRTRWNDAHRIVLDDGTSTNYSTVSGSALPWMSKDYVPRVGASVTFPGPVVLYKDFGVWRVEPSTPVAGVPSSTQPQLEQTRAAEAAPAPVGGDVRLATFNVLNFFPTTGEEYVGNGLGVCTYYDDRQAHHITTRNCGNPSTDSGNGPRGAANADNLARQQTKIVSAITTADADIVSLEELENSAKFGKSRDFAIGQLVDALNQASAPGTWAYAPSPTGADLPPIGDEDVIRTGFIYQPAAVSLVGSSRILVGSAAFANAREPLAQAFKKTGAPDSAAFTVIVNHFKSKGSGADDGTGQGNSNPDRVAQANALVGFANQFKADRGTDRVFLVGDFNAYSHEDPVQVLETAGYAAVDSTTDPGEETYNFDGQIGSLDHVFANAPAKASVTGADVWPINGYESVLYEYSRYNANITDLYDAGPFRSSDHSPEIVGITATTPVAQATVQSPPAVSVTYGQPTVIPVQVSAAGAAPTGTVTVSLGAATLGTGTLTGGRTTVTIPPSSLAPGTYSLTVRYSGDGAVQPASTTTTLSVAKAASSVEADTKQDKPTVGDKIKVVVDVQGAGGLPATGQVTVVVKGGRDVTATLVNGSVVVKAGRYTKPGKRTVVITYLGSSTLEASTTTLKVKVKPKTKGGGRG